MTSWQPWLKVLSWIILFGGTALVLGFAALDVWLERTKGRLRDWRPELGPNPEWAERVARRGVVVKFDRRRDGWLD